MITLDDAIAGILDGMPALPPGVAREVADRLPDVATAMGADMIEEGTILLAVRDLTGEDVVLSVVIRRHFAHLDVSSNAEGVALSHGYDLLLHEGRDAEVRVDRQHRLCRVDHEGRIGGDIATRRAIDAVRAARPLMERHSRFTGVVPEGGRD